MLVECLECEGTGVVHYSCCGDDVKGTIYEDYDLCPTCKEHLGGPEPCENCDGTGKIEVFNEHDIISVLEDIEGISKNTKGTIVHIYNDYTFEVEFQLNNTSLVVKLFKYQVKNEQTGASIS